MDDFSKASREKPERFDGLSGPEGNVIATRAESAHWFNLFVFAAFHFLPLQMQLFYR
jgi:hypothetical protein